MAGRTYVVDIDHMVWAADPQADGPAPARKLALFMGRVVEEVTGGPSTRLLRCNRARCPGLVVGRIVSLKTLEWFCTSCEECGTIASWRGSPWDRTGQAQIQEERPPRAVAEAPIRPNPWCERLGIKVPLLEAIDAKVRLKVREAVVVALLEHGGPMQTSELVARLEAADIESLCGDMSRSVRTALRVRAPIVKTADGRFALDPTSAALGGLVHVLLRSAPTS